MKKGISSVSDLIAMEHLMRDIRHGARMLAKSPGFTLLAALTFALGIGVNVTIFSAVNSALFKPFYGDRPQELVEVFAGDADTRTGFSAHSYIDYLDYRSGAAPVVSGLTAFYTEPGYLGLAKIDMFVPAHHHPCARRAFQSSIALIACGLPARRAARVDPMSSLK
jgi:hypothetical protein